MCVIAAMVSTAHAATTIQSITAANAWTTFDSSTDVLTMTGSVGIVSYASGNTYTGGTFTLTTTLTSDTSSGGTAIGTFTGGTFTYTDSASNVLLSGTITSLNLTELYGILAGQASFAVTSGSLWTDFGSSAGSLIDVSFYLSSSLSDFSSSFTALSNVTVVPVPEPTTVALLSLGTLLFRKKK